MQEKPIATRYRLSMRGKIAIAISGIVIISLMLLDYAYERPETFPFLPVYGAFDAPTLKLLLGAAVVVIDGAAKATLLSFAVKILFRVNIQRIVQSAGDAEEALRAEIARLRAAQPVLVDQTTGDWLKQMMADSLRNENAQLRDEAQRLLADKERLLSAIDGLSRRLELDDTLFDRLAHVIDEAKRMRTETAPS